MNTHKNSTNHEVILVVEDSPTQLERLLIILDAHGFKTMAAVNGREALERVAEERPAIVISDIVMPEMDGYALCTRLKDDVHTRHIPVILLTALGDPKDVLRGLECGADNFITKPYNEGYLISRIQSILANLKLRESKITRMGIEISFGGETYFITSERQQILDLLLSTYEAAVQKNIELMEAQDELRNLNEQLEEKVRERTAELRQEVEERKLAEAKVIHLNRLYSMLSLSNQAIIRLADQQELLERICHIAIEVGQFNFAWVALKDEESGRLRVAAQRGYDDGYLDKLVAAVNDPAQDHSPAVEALRQGKQLSCRDVRNQGCLLPWREEALQNGFLAFATFPLLIEDQWVGSFNVHAADTLFADDKETGLLEEVANDLSFALTSLRHEELRRQTEEALNASEKRYRTTVAAANDAIICTRPPDTVYLWNRKAEEIFGYSEEEAQGKDIHELIIPSANHDEVLAGVAHFLKTGTGPHVGRSSEFMAMRKSGEMFPVELSLAAMHIKNEWHAVGIVRDITARKRTEEERKKLSFAVEQSSDWILITDSEGRITYANKAVEQISGYTREEIMGQSPSLFAAEDHDRIKCAEMQETIGAGRTFEGIITSRKKNGRPFELYYSVSPIKDEEGRITNFVYTAKDITQQRLLEERLDYLAYHDALTGLPNRGLFQDRLQRDLVKAEAEQQSVAVLHLDINGFKTINETFGAAVGDQVLIEVSKRLSESVHEGDTVARYANDEFRISFAEPASPEEIILTAEKVITAVSQPMTIDNEELAITANMGIAVYPTDGKSADELLHNTALALEKSKEVGRRGYYFYTPSLDAEANEYLLVKRHLFNALKKDEFVLHYQPYFDITTQKMVGMEALIRWQSADLGRLVPPGKFVPILEDTRLIVEVGEWALKTAVRQVQEWQERGLPVVPVSVNLSTIQFREKGLFETVAKIMQEARLRPGMLTLEITETAFMKDIGLTTRVLKDFRDRGFGVSIDDFGTGYSSLSYLKRFPVDNLKIDISFVRDITTDPDAASIITAIIAMAHGLNIKTIAEGVETKEQWNILRLLRCDVGQGYFFSKPVPALEVEQIMQVKP